MRTDEAFCRQMLHRVSRTFALTIRFLPGDIRYSVTVSYLLCRIADTIEDSATLEAGVKIDLLGRFRAAVAAGADDAEAVRAAFRPDGGADALLTHRADIVLREYLRLPDSHQRVIAPWVLEMCDGMADFVRTMAARPGTLQTLNSISELEQYCYYVAGTVGHLLTGLFLLRMGRVEESREKELRRLAPGFGLGLQLTNIAQDYATDASRGVAYVPRDLRMDDVVKLAMGRLREGREYCLHLPRSQYRVRLFCLAALFFALKTLRAVRLKQASADQRQKAKISRADVYRTLAVASVASSSNGLLEKYFDALEKMVGAVTT